MRGSAPQTPAKGASPSGHPRTTRGQSLSPSPHESPGRKPAGLRGGALWRGLRGCPLGNCFPLPLRGEGGGKKRGASPLLTPHTGADENSPRGTVCQTRHCVLFAFWDRIEWVVLGDWFLLVSEKLTGIWTTSPPCPLSFERRGGEIFLWLRARLRLALAVGGLRHGECSPAQDSHCLSRHGGKEWAQPMNAGV